MSEGKIPPQIEIKYKKGIEKTEYKKIENIFNFIWQLEVIIFIKQIRGIKKNFWSKYKHKELEKVKIDKLR